jgi:hypothetical protein
MVHLSLFPEFGYCEWCCNKHGVQVPLLYPGARSFYYMHRSGIAGSYGSSIFSFLWTSILLSSAVGLIYILINNVKVFLYPVVSPAFVVTCVIDASHCDWVEVETQYILICSSFMGEDVEHFFMYLLSFCTSSFENCRFCSFPIYSVGYWFSERLFFWAPLIFWLLIPCQMYSWQRFSPTCQSVFEK